MLSNNRVIIAAAGSGKTTLLIREAVSKPDRAIAIVTYTDNNEQELKKKFYEHVGHIPPNVTIMTWFSFLLAECVRPYQNYVYSEHRIDSINFVEGKSAPYINRSDVKNYYFSDERLIYTDKISAFACRCEEVSGGLVTQRLAQIYDEIYIDEVQDLAGYDLELIERFLNTSITMLLVGDIRQGTYVTNNSAKNSGQRGKDIILRFEKWQKKNLCTIEHLSNSYRCNQSICDFADNLYPDLQKTTSCNTTVTGHDGIFLLPSILVEEYVNRFSPAVLRYNNKSTCLGLPAINFGTSKGLSFDRVLIFPHGPITSYIVSGNREHVLGSLSKFYVAITRARYSVAIVHDGLSEVIGVTRYAQTEHIQETMGLW